MHGDAWWCTVMPDHDAWSCLIRTGSLQIPTYDKVWSECFFVGGRWGEWMGVVGKGILESTFTILYIQIEPYRMVLFFCLKTTNKSTKWFVVFWKMPIHRSQVGLVLQNGLVFLVGDMFTDGFMCWTTLQNGFVFSEKWKNTWLFLKDHY